MIIALNDSSHSRMVSWDFFSLFNVSPFLEVINGLSGNLDLRLSDLMYQLAVVWLEVPDLELLMIKRSLRSLVSVLNQKHDCNLRSILS